MKSETTFLPGPLDTIVLTLECPLKKHKNRKLGKLEKSAITEEKWPKNGPKFDLSNLSPPGKMAKKGYKWVCGKFLGRSFI